MTVLIITRTFDPHSGAEILSAPIPADSVRNVWDGNTLTVYQPGDELPPVDVVGDDGE